jgi:hypothetical protein
MNCWKNCLFSLVTFLCISVTAQVPDIYLQRANINSNIGGTSVKKGDTVDMVVMYRENMSYTRTLYFDFQYNYRTFTILDVTAFPAGQDSSTLPQGANISIQNNFHPGYTYLRNSNNYTRNGTQNYYNANYSYSQTSDNAIQRIYTTVTSNDGFRDGKYLRIRIRVNNVPAGTAYDSLYMNFVSGWRSDGAGIQTNMPDPRSAFITLDANANTLVTGNLYKNPAIPTTIRFVDSATNQAVSFAPDVNGVFKAASELKANTTYKVSVNIDSLQNKLLSAITVSDATAALNEFGNVNLDGTFNKTNLKTGAGWLAADVNYNGKFDGADPYLLLAQVANTAYIEPKVYTYNRQQFSADSLPVQDFVYFRTTTTNKTLDLNYLIAGDINRSHSSQVVASDGAIRSFSFVNTPVATKTPIGVYIATTIVNTDNINIPIITELGTNSICGLQFEIAYDATKLQLLEVQSNTNASWLNFFTDNNGVIRFGGIDKTLKEPLTGKGAPYVLKFKTLVPGVDINTYLNVTDNMDASDNKGNQVGINLTTSNIRLIGTNNFK